MTSLNRNLPNSGEKLVRSTSAKHLKPGTRVLLPKSVLVSFSHVKHAGVKTAFSTVLIISMKKLLIISTVVEGERTHPGSVFSKTSVKEISVSSGKLRSQLSFPGLKKMKQGNRSNPAPSLHIFPYFFFFCSCFPVFMGPPNSVAFISSLTP